MTKTLAQSGLPGILKKQSSAKVCIIVEKSAKFFTPIIHAVTFIAHDHIM